MGYAVQEPSALVVGRETELGAVHRFVGDLDVGASSLVLEGIAGIGKTMIWQRGVHDARAAGISVRTCRCTVADSSWAFSGLGDLLENLPDDVLAQLPAVQRDALSSALLLADVADFSPGTRVVGVAVLAVLRSLVRAGPLVIAIDDVQWLDVSSRKVLTFAIRRLVEEPIRLLTSLRTGWVGTTAGTAEVADLGLPGERIAVGPVSIGVMNRIVQSRLNHTLTRSTLVRLHQATGGSPMMCLEMARAMALRGRQPAAGEPLTVPADLRLLVIDRLRALSPAALQLVTLVSALAQPTIASIEAAVGERDLSARCLSEAISGEVLELEGERLRFSHPLLASVAYADLTADARRHLHQRLALIVTDPEEHARHAALGSNSRSAVVAAALDVASRHARRRGSIDAAAELAELAVAATPTGQHAELLRRTVETAEYLLLLGDPVQARAVLTGPLATVMPGPHRVPGLLLQATIASLEQGDATVGAWCDQALSEAGDDTLLQARCHATFAETCPSGATLDLWHAERSVALLAQLPDAPVGLLAGALTNVAAHGLRLGHGLAVAMLTRAVDLQEARPPIPVTDRAATALGMFLKVVDRFDESRTWLQEMLTCAVDEGDDSALPLILGHLATLECWAGNYAAALSYAQDGRRHEFRMGIRAPMPTSAHVLTLAHLGRIEEARTLAAADIATDDAIGFRSALALHRRSLGFAELVAGNAAAAAEHLLSAAAISFDEVGIREPAILRLHQDAVAALIALDRIDQAWEMTAQLEESAEAHHRPWATAMSGRCHGQLWAHQGELVKAAEVLERTVIDHQRLPMPYEEARTRLLYGSVLRRSGHRNDARREFQAAEVIFSRLGTPILLARSQAELVSLGGRRGQDSELTPVEQRIAALVAAGQTNKEVAAALFVSVRTIEGHLGHVYQKFGIRSRTELARRMSEQLPTPQSAVSQPPQSGSSTRAQSTSLF